MSHQDDLDNHANQLNPEHEAYWESRGYDGVPDDYQYDDDQDDEEKPSPVDAKPSIQHEPIKESKKKPARKNNKKSSGKSHPMSSYDYLLKVGEVRRRKREALRQLSPWHKDDE